MHLFPPSLTLLFTILLFISQSLHAQKELAAPHPFIVTGVVKNSNSAILLEKFAHYLSRHSGYPLKISFATNYSELSRKLRIDPLALGWTCGAPYVQDHKLDNQQLVAVPTFNQNPTYYSVVLTRSTRHEKTLVDFKGGILAYSDPRSNSGFLSPKYALHRQGIKMESHFRLLINAGNHEGSIEALLNGLADVAAVDEYIWLAYIKSSPEVKTRLREVERMGPFPFTPIVASKGVSTSVIKKLSNVLVNMKNDADGKKILKQFGLDEFIIKDNSFYKPIEKILNEVEIITGK
jgi:phosphate/phosphite/phosphonate ABC transporter binding protein